VVPGALRDKDLFAVLRRHDVLLHHPYESFVPVMDFLGSAAKDPKVVAIKQTVYRTGADSALMESLMAAARAGKEVTVVVELMARFDEETNINWAERLESVGAHVVYGVVGHKTHAKMAMVIRRENGRLHRYVHLGTGNYHPRTARLYEDFGLLTANETLCADVHEVFRRLTGLGRAGALQSLLQSPFTLRDTVIAAIRREAHHARAGRKGQVTAKVNALLSEDVIEALYDASQAGVKIDLIVRGVRAAAGREGAVREHPRSLDRRTFPRAQPDLLLLERRRARDVWLSSADWMDRNLLRRVEVAFPILDRKLRKRVIDEGLAEHLADNTAAWVMNSEGEYTRRRPGRARPAQFPGATAPASRRRSLRFSRLRSEVRNRAPHRRVFAGVYHRDDIRTPRRPRCSRPDSPRPSASATRSCRAACSGSACAELGVGGGQRRRTGLHHRA
jgi:polyphosphate kinase